MTTSTTTSDVPHPAGALRVYDWEDEGTEQAEQMSGYDEVAR